MPKYFILLALCSGTCFFSCDDGHREQPNIIIINVDDLGYKDLGFMGSKYYETPHIDSLSRLGMRFTNGYAAASNCAPSRACLMTGRWSTFHGIYTVGSSQRGESKDRKLIPTVNTTTLTEKEKVLPRVLQQNGYFSIHSGKWHIGENPLDYGFDVNIGGGKSGLPMSYYAPFGNINLDGDGNLTDLIMEKTIHLLDSVKQPFFLNYAPYAVHVPIQPIPGLLPKYQSKQPSAGQKNAGYATMIENLDRNIGLLISALKRNKLFDNTLIIFTSDNGGHFAITRQYPLRAGKGSYYEGGIREPFFFILRKRIKENTVSDVPITNLDLLPTIMDFAGISKDQFKVDGTSIRPVLEEEVVELDRPLFWHFPIYLETYDAGENEDRDSLFRTRPGSVVRYGPWKLHYYFEDNEVELYNLDDDIGERNDLSESNAQKVEELTGYLDSWWKETNAPIPGELNAEYQEPK
jgi:arylsulfatase A-like enzyme